MQNIIPGFDRFEQIGEGLFAVVWKAHQVTLDRMVAIKIIKPQFTSKVEEVRAFINEARAAAKLKHQNIIQVYDVAEQDGIYYFVMEYVPGLTVAKMISEEGSIPEKRALKIVTQVAEALEEAWEKGSIIHRNISPKNIMQDSDGTVKIADLGMSKLSDFAAAANQTGNLQIRGLCNYISPEQALHSSQLDCRADMYSIGATLYHMVTGEMPFDICTPAQIMSGLTTEMIANPRDLKPNLSPGIVRLLTKLMMKDPKNRYRSWNEVLKDIGKVAGGYSIAAPHIPGAASTIDNSQVVAPQQGAARVQVHQPAPQIRVQAPVQVRVPSAAAKESSTDNQTAPSPAQAAAAAPKPGKGIAGIIRIPFWTAMLGFWAYLFITLLRLPELDYESIKPPIDDMFLDDAPKARTTAVETGKPSAEPVSGSDYKPGTPATNEPAATATTTEKKPDEKTATTEKPPAADPAAAATPKLSKELVKSVAENLTGEKYDLALDAVKKALSSSNLEVAVKADLESLKKIVTETSRINAAVEKTFQDQIGNDVDMKINNVKRKVSIVAIIGSKVNVEYSGGGSAPNVSYTFSINQMDPAEKVKWLGKLNTPSKFVMKYILDMKAKNFEAARDVADKCGPFAELFKAEAEAKIPPPAAPKEKTEP